MAGEATFSLEINSISLSRFSQPKSNFHIVEDKNSLTLGYIKPYSIRKPEILVFRHLKTLRKIHLSMIYFLHGEINEYNLFVKPIRSTRTTKLLVGSIGLQTERNKK